MVAIDTYFMHFSYNDNILRFIEGTLLNIKFAVIFLQYIL